MWSSSRWPPGPVASSTARSTACRPISAETSHEAQPSTVLPLPQAWRTTVPPTCSSSRVSGVDPPAIWKLRKGRVIVKGGDVSVPVLASPP